MSIIMISLRRKTVCTFTFMNTTTGMFILMRRSMPRSMMRMIMTMVTRTAMIILTHTGMPAMSTAE